jgi:hypothetical protein
MMAAWQSHYCNNITVHHQEAPEQEPSQVYFSPNLTASNAKPQYKQNNIIAEYEPFNLFFLVLFFCI